MYLNLLLLCGILSQGVIGTFADGNITESTDLLVRQKRVINFLPGEDTRPLISHYPYIVMIKLHMRITCAGTILSHYVVITICECVLSDVPHTYNVVSKSARSDHGNSHNVIEVRRYYINPQRSTNGIALVTVNPPFEYGAYTRNIDLHTGPLVPNTIATITGWGYNCGGIDPGTKYPKNLRYIQVPIMAHQDCVNIYRPYNIEITDKEICTYHPHKHCGHIDGGAPLVVDGSLVGIHLWTGPAKNQINFEFPDVFAVLQVSEYHQWIRRNIQSIERLYGK